MITKKQIDKLKANWLKDPCWDIETTEGFEDHIKELKQFRLEHEARWDKERLEREEREKNKTFQDRIAELRGEIEIRSNQVGDEYFSLPEESQLIQLMQVQATLLLAEQVNTVIGLLESLAKPTFFTNNF